MVNDQEPPEIDETDPDVIPNQYGKFYWNEIGSYLLYSIDHKTGFSQFDLRYILVKKSKINLK